MVNTELYSRYLSCILNYNILNIVVNTEQGFGKGFLLKYYNILNIVVNTEQKGFTTVKPVHYNILNIVVNTELYCS